MAKFSTKYGYFSDDGNEYVIKDPRTPKPWINVISNGSYGFVISQTGGGFSWNVHSEFNRITRWHQDLVQDNWGKYIYIKNNVTGEIWSPTWMPVKTELDFYECRYGFGYAKFTSEYKGIKTELLLFVPFDETLEIWDLKIINNSGQNADLSIYTYFEWALGSSNDHHREFHKLFLETTFDDDLNGITATKRLWDIPLGDRGHWNVDYEYTGFFACNKKICSYEGDKEAFIGKYGSVQNPESLKLEKLMGLTGSFNDSIASLHLNIQIDCGNEDRLDFYLGLKNNYTEIIETMKIYSSFQKIDSEFDKVKNEWNKLLGTLVIETPEEGMNIFINKWVRYQSIAGRLWGRTAYYQQSGAFGFRDQLQDSLVFLPIDPSKTLEQIRLHSKHQFQDGTVLHWWHPISETGLQTRMTDDLLWLPFVVVNYIEETNDYSILDLEEPFFDRPDKTGSIFIHCQLAIDKVLSRMSDRGLPLIGAGDWNDGLSAVGLEQKGESLWLAEFLYLVLEKFSSIAEDTEHYKISKFYLKKAEELKIAFNNYAWDGEWFLRATKDSGEKLGSNKCINGKIYLNAQTWAVISGISDDDKLTTAMNSVEKYLLKNNGCLLLSPAYSKPDKYIGYLSRYAPGRRENGGVYSHASTWAVQAFSLLNNADLAYQTYKRLSPVYSGMEPDKYQAEPYVMPGNIDGPDSPNYGMAGWTWYTGSASWMQKVVVDWILGIRASKKGLIIDPRIPKEWDGFKIKRIFRGCEINIEVTNPNHVTSGVKCVSINNVKHNNNIIIPAEEKNLQVHVELG